MEVLHAFIKLLTDDNINGVHFSRGGFNVELSNREQEVSCILYEYDGHKGKSYTNHCEDLHEVLSVLSYYISMIEYKYSVNLSKLFIDKKTLAFKKTLIDNKKRDFIIFTNKWGF